jgi:hypothetical protein
MKCCICGTVRNCASYLDKIFQNIELIGSLFEDYVIIIYYDVSNDNTLEKLKKYQERNNRLNFYVNTSPLLEYRTYRLALGRNQCLNIIKEKYRDYPYFIMMDCDDVCSRDIKVNLLNNYLHRNDWDALSFNHPVGYYDSWALSKRPYLLSCHHFIDPGQCQRLITNIIKKTPQHKLIKCLSAFNGFAIYRTDKFINCYYDGRFRIDYIPKNLIKENIKFSGKIISGLKEDCEHRHFHIQAALENNARIRISPRCLFY